MISNLRGFIPKEMQPLLEKIEVMDIISLSIANTIMASVLAEKIAEKYKK